MDFDNVVQGVHGYGDEKEYCIPSDPLVRNHLDWWQDQKLGFMVHWGPYSQWGVVESWALSSDDAEWSRVGLSFDDGDEKLKDRYFALNKTFNPVRFAPEEWADAAVMGGFRYLVFTTKHHDGFSMYDTSLSDYKITSLDCPYHANKNADICKVLFNAFRGKGMGIAAYFSKADWHSPFYWEPGSSFLNSSRGPTYSPKMHPDLWNQFSEFARGQILELVSGYGPIDILWFDAGWVNPRSDGQDLHMDKLAAECRELQPGLIIADRTVGGQYENYLTPEQTVPAEPLLVPWESSITMGTSFSYKYDDAYKSLKELVHLLIEVVAKGGNLVINVGAQPDGRLPQPAMDRMKQLGQWLDEYGEAIYGTRPRSPYVVNNFYFTEKNDVVYCFHFQDEVKEGGDDSCLIPISDQFNRVDLIGAQQNMPFWCQMDGIKVNVSAATRRDSIVNVYRLSK